jgi:hypothetical protein
MKAALQSSFSGHCPTVQPRTPTILEVSTYRSGRDLCGCTLMEGGPFGSGDRGSVAE